MRVVTAIFSVFLIVGPGTVSAQVSPDGARTVLVTWEHRGAMVSITAMDFGPLSECDGNGG